MDLNMSMVAREASQGLGPGPSLGLNGLPGIAPAKATKKPKKAVLFFEVEILDAKTREKLCFLDKVGPWRQLYWAKGMGPGSLFLPGASGSEEMGAVQLDPLCPSILCPDSPPTPQRTRDTFPRPVAATLGWSGHRWPLGVARSWPPGGRRRSSLRGPCRALGPGKKVGV